MLYNAAEFSRLRTIVLSVSGLAWVSLLLGQGGRNSISPCCLMPGQERSLASMLSLNPPAITALWWLVMLVAMMAPMLISPIYDIYLSSFKRRLIRSVALFVAGYAALWMAAGVFVWGVEIVALVLMPDSYIPALITGVIALIWQASPLKQKCLNQCHSHGSISAFGAEADRDALLMGFKHGRWCVGSCWAIMLFPMLLPNGHFVAMALVTILMFSERLDRSRIPSWRMRGLEALWTYISFRTRSILRGQSV